MNFTVGFLCHFVAIVYEYLIIVTNFYYYISELK